MTGGQRPSPKFKGSLEVLMVIGSMNVGGAESHVAQVASVLDFLSHCVDRYESLYRGLAVGKTADEGIGVSFVALV